MARYEGDSPTRFTGRSQWSWEVDNNKIVDVFVGIPQKESVQKGVKSAPMLLFLVVNSKCSTKFPAAEPSIAT